MKHLILLFAIFSASASAFSPLVKKQNLHLEFGHHQQFKEIKKLNSEISSKDISFCNFNLKAELCLSTISNEKYVLDIENRIVKKVDRTTQKTGLKLKSVDDIELEMLLYFLDDVASKIENNYFNSVKSFSNELGIRSKSTVTNSLTSSSIYPNGCGTPNHGSYAIIPDRPFWGACNEHDVCYATYINKSKCDSEFYSDMKAISKDVASDVSGDFPVAYEVVLGMLTSMAYTYYQAVDNLETAMDAYCVDKGTECKAVNGDFNVVHGNDDVIEGSGDGGNGDIFPPQLYNDEICLMPVRYYTCAYNRCVGNVITVPCP